MTAPKEWGDHWAMSFSPIRAALLALLTLFLASPAKATWSIVVINRETGELAVATSTCIAGFDIATAVPVIRVGYAAGAAQSFVISRRPTAGASSATRSGAPRPSSSWT